MDVKLEKFVYTKTHLAVKSVLFFQSSEKLRNQIVNN